MHLPPLHLDLSGCLDHDTAASVQDRFAAAIAVGAGDVTLDFSHLRFLDASGIAAIAFLFKRLAAQRRALRIQGAAGQPQATLQDHGLARVLGLTAAAAPFRGRSATVLVATG